MDVLRGQSGTSMLTFAKRWRWSRGKAKRFFGWLERERMIGQQTGHLTTITTICNYNLYQLDPDSDRTSDGTTDGHLTGQQTDIKRTSGGTHPIRIKKNKEELIRIKNNTHGFSDAFERWWNLYPKRRGRKVGKKAAANLFEKIPKKSWDDLKTATENYSKECDGLPKDPERFLRNNFWKDFLKAADKNLDGMSEQAMITIEQCDETERNQRLSASSPENNSSDYADVCPEDEIPF